MKRLLLLLLFPILSQAQTTTWPHNPRTGEIELQGTLPWPDSAKTELQRHRLIQHWYLTKLAALLAHKPPQTISPTAPADGIPLAVCLRRYQAATSLLSVTCQAALSPTPQGLAYQFTDFSFNWWDDDAGGSTSLDTLVLTGPAAVKAREIIAIARKRLAVLSSW